MADSKITALTSYTNPDGANDVIPIVDVANTQTKKITRNSYLGITGSPVGTTDTQALTNKTISNTNTITLKATLFTLQDASDTTKQAQFVLSGITAGNTRSYTLPNASGTLVDLASAQALTNKTLTGPVISGGTIDNSTITVDSISGHTSATIVTVGGVQMNNGVINTAGAVTSTSVADGAIQPKMLQSGAGTGWSWQSYVPTWANLTVGNGTNTGSYVQTGKSVFFRVQLTLGTTSSVSNNPTFTLPVTSINYGNTFFPIGLTAFDNGAAKNGWLTWASTTTAIPRVWDANNDNGSVTSTNPFTWGTGHRMQFNGFYEAP